MTGSPFTRCPDCNKKGVQFHFGKVIPGEDGYGCRYCDFWFFTALDTEVDRGRHLEWAAVNHHCAVCSGFLVGADDSYICEDCGDEWPIDVIDMEEGL